MLRGVPRAATRALQTRGLHFTAGGQGQGRKSEDISTQYPGRVHCELNKLLFVIHFIKLFGDSCCQRLFVIRIVRLFLIHIVRLFVIQLV
jgi:hypothetical protein